VASAVLQVVLLACRHKLRTSSHLLTLPFILARGEAGTTVPVRRIRER
jgi:hypothetical protein